MEISGWGKVEDRVIEGENIKVLRGQVIKSIIYGYIKILKN